jgi:transglutaminase-like putative cysteine protease
MNGPSPHAVTTLQPTATGAEPGPQDPPGAPGAGAPAWAEIEVVHDTCYDYAAPVTPAWHVAHLQPLADAAQQLCGHELQIDPPPDELDTERDVFGNARCLFSVVAPHRRLHVRATSRVRLVPRFDALAAAASPPCEAVAARLRYVARARFEPAVEFVQPSPYVPRLQALRAWARADFPPGRPAAAAALALMARLHAEFRYDGEATAVDTPLAEVFALRRGVCQDFAHLMIGALRLHGLPARYVSGYLLTQPPDDDGPGQPPLVGADASHAWLQVWVPGTPGLPDDGWLDLDPTNDLVPAAGHVRVAVGRDYGDVAPLRGVIHGGGAHTLTVGVHSRRLGGADGGADGGIGGGAGPGLA